MSEIRVCAFRWSLARPSVRLQDTWHLPCGMSTSIQSCRSAPSRLLQHDPFHTDTSKGSIGALHVHIVQLTACSSMPPSSTRGKPDSTHDAVLRMVAV